MLAERAKQQRVIEQAGDGILPQADFVGIPQGMKHPVPEKARSHRGDGAIEHTEKRHCFPGAGLDEFQVCLRRGVKDEKLAGAIGLEPAEVRRISSHLSDQVVQESPCRTHGGRQIIAAETVERMDLEMLSQEFRRRQGLENVAVKKVGVPESPKKIFLLLGSDHLGRQDAGEFVDEKLDVRQLRQAKLSGGQFTEGQANHSLATADRSEVVRTAIIEAKVVERASAQDLADFAANQLSGLHFADLVAYRCAPPGGYQLFDVASRRMKRNSAHGRLAALCESHIENARRLSGIVAEHFVEIPQPEKQQSVGRQLTPDGMVLLHHGCLRITGHGGLTQRWAFAPICVLDFPAGFEGDGQASGRTTVCAHFTLNPDGSMAHRPLATASKTPREDWSPRHDRAVKEDRPRRLLGRTRRRP